MQAKGFIKFVATLCFLASIWMLAFTFVTRRVEKNARIEATDESGIIDKTKEAAILAAKSNEKVWLGYTYKECKDKELGLGLDLKGGMNVMLEISLPDIITALSNNSADTTFVKALARAKQNEKTSTKDFLSLFEEAWIQLDPDKPMSRVFSTYELKDRIKLESSNADVLKIIRQESESAVSNSFNVLRSRIDRFGVASPNIQRIGVSGRIFVELPGVKEPERVRKLLQGTANLEFWPTYENEEIYPRLEQANAIIKEIIAAEKKNTKDIDSLAIRSDDADNLIANYDNKSDSLALTDSSNVAPISPDSSLAAIVTDSSKKDSSLLAQIQAQDSTGIAGTDDFPLFQILNPAIGSQNGQSFLNRGPVIGFAAVADTAKIGQWLRMARVRALFPKEFQPKWSIKPVDKGETIYELIAIKVTTRDGKAPLDGGVITDARRSTERNGFGVSMSMDAEGSKIWARMTADNIKKSIAIVLDGFVYSYPRVDGEIPGGQSSITGNFTSNEADDLANVLKSGKMPAPARIVQEAVVGPSLGQESINSGMISFILAFLLVLAYMWLYYGQAGTTANIALLSNVLLLFGAMASFGAVLTLPGIAGIVLTLGMAVDANVIIYERVKEELRAGNSQRVAIKEGYKNAMSAIVDGQMTTFITGVILLMLGTGPVKGFAVTLVTGIITSLTTSIFISRLVIEWMLNRGKNISFGNKFTMNFMSDMNIDFLAMRRKMYIVSGVVLITGLAFIFTKGMSYGIDFSGGRTYVVKFDQAVATDQVREAVSTFDGSAEVKQYGPNNQLKITTKYRIDDNSDEASKEIEQLLYNASKEFFVNKITFDEFASTDTDTYGISSSETVGPTIATDMRTKAIIAVILALIAIFIYIAARFSRWQFGLGGVLSLAHDALFTIAIFSVGAGLLPWSMDVDQSFIAAILTIIGYSINDTVVIFDRVRENRILYPKRSWREQINGAINSTLMRTINTSGTVLVVLLAIFIFGGEVIRGFSFAIIIGVVVGVYSTVFIAIPVAYEFLSRKEIKAKELEQAAKQSHKSAAKK
ncbi:MAG: protein translocase subunit SecDF [Prevotellaceae bacterium]|jgi:SecD/SecF fusion protein|nr:protein translocase subunit SecDF [Prevotellaceae bacterium]